MKQAIIAVVFAACTDAPPEAPDGCEVDLSGNFVESATTDCPTLVPGVGATQGDTLLRFRVASQMLGGNFLIDLDLGATPTPGVYNSGTTALWNAMGVKTVAPAGACLFVAGNNSTPTGTFELALTAIDEITAHGDLTLTMFVLPRTADDGTQTDCGPGTTEDAQVRF